MSEVRNLAIGNNKVFMVCDLDSNSLCHPVEKLIVMSAVHSEAGGDDFIMSVVSLYQLNEVTNLTWREMGQFVYDEVKYNVYGTDIHPLSVKPESLTISIQPKIKTAVFDLSPISRSPVPVGFLTIYGSKEYILDEYVAPNTENDLIKLCHAYVDECNNRTLSNGITRTLITSIPAKYKPVFVRPVDKIDNLDVHILGDFETGRGVIVKPMKETIEVKTFKTAIQDQKISADDDEIAEWIGDRELVSIDSVVSDNKLIRTVTVKR